MRWQGEGLLLDVRKYGETSALIDVFTKSLGRRMGLLKGAFNKKNKSENLYFIIGSDILIELHRWKNWKKIVKLTKLIVFSRNGYDKKVKDSIVVKYLKKNNITFIKNKPIKISSTILRKKIGRYT